MSTQCVNIAPLPFFFGANVFAVCNSASQALHWFVSHSRQLVNGHLDPSKFAHLRDSDRVQHYYSDVKIQHGPTISKTCRLLILSLFSDTLNIIPYLFFFFNSSWKFKHLVKLEADCYSPITARTHGWVGRCGCEGACIYLSLYTAANANRTQERWWMHPSR